MEFPDSVATRMTERIMEAVKPHLLRDPFPQENHHYNRAYEAVYKILSDNADLKVTPRKI
jgi:hypothetical protein